MIEALKTLKDELDAGTEASKAVQYAAAEWEVKETVLRIRFEKAYGVAPEQYVSKPTVSKEEVVQKALAAEVARWRLTAVGEQYVGKKFFRDGEWWLFAAYDGRKVYCVRADTGKTWTFWGPKNICSIFGQVEKLIAA